MTSFPIIAVVYDDGSTGSQEMSSIGAARGLSVDLKSDPSVFAVEIYGIDGKVDRWSWEREE